MIRTLALYFASQNESISSYEAASDRQNEELDRQTKISGSLKDHPKKYNSGAFSTCQVTKLKRSEGVRFDFTNTQHIDVNEPESSTNSDNTSESKSEGTSRNKWVVCMIDLMFFVYCWGHSNICNRLLLDYHYCKWNYSIPFYLLSTGRIGLPIKHYKSDWYRRSKEGYQIKITEVSMIFS